MHKGVLEPDFEVPQNWYELKQAFDELKGYHATQKQTIANLLDEKQQFKSQIRLLEIELNSSKKTLAEERQLLAEARDEIEALDKRVTDLKGECDSWRSVDVASRSIIRKLETENKELKERDPGGVEREQGEAYRRLECCRVAQIHLDKTGGSILGLAHRLSKFVETGEPDDGC